MSVAGNYHHLTEKPEAGDALILHSPPQTQNPYPPVCREMVSRILTSKLNENSNEPSQANRLSSTLITHGKYEIGLLKFSKDKFKK